MTTGLLEWGQAASYNAPDDRRVITALAAGRAAGVVNPVVLTAGSGLNVNVAANWLAVADCQDGTLGVAGTGSAMVVPGAAGDAGAPRTDSLWCDISPTNGTFALVIIPQSAETGRLGIRLATITVPTGANLASAFTLTPRVASFANFPNGLNLGTSAALWTITPESPAGYLKLQQGANPPLFVSNAGLLVAQYPPGPTGTVPEGAFHSITLSGTWANVTGQGLEMKFMPDDTVIVHGSIVIPTGVTGPANTIAVLNANYRPIRNENVTVHETINASPFTSTVHAVLVRPGGQFDLFGAATAGNNLNVNVRYPLHGTVFP